MEHHLRMKLLGLLAGAVIAVGVMSVWLTATSPDSLWNRLNAYLLPTELREAFFLYQDGDTNTLYHLGQGVYEPVSIGTIFPTTFFSRRGDNFASIQLAPQGEYEVRIGAERLHASKNVTTSAASSPSGDRLAFTEAGVATLLEVNGRSTASLPSSVMFMEKGDAGPVLLGSGFFPFFLSEDEVAWFSSLGLMKHDLRTGTTSLLSAEVTPLPPPYPHPAVSSDASTLAWVTPDTGTITVAKVNASGIQVVRSYPAAKGPSIALSNDYLFVLERTTDGTTPWRYTLSDQSEPTPVKGLPRTGSILQLIP